MQKTKKNTYNYGECEICDTPMEEHYIRQDFWIRGELIVIDHVLAGVCPQCGEKVVNAKVGRHIAELLQNSERIAAAPRISVPVLSFDDEAEQLNFEQSLV
jgi:YgiT-type zinc finger domain-containing protein